MPYVRERIYAPSRPRARWPDRAGKTAIQALPSDDPATAKSGAASSPRAGISTAGTLDRHPWLPQAAWVTLDGATSMA
jgi:hypothetical protein